MKKIIQSTFIAGMLSLLGAQAASAQPFRGIAPTDKAAIEEMVNRDSRVPSGLKLKSGKLPVYPPHARSHDVEGTVLFTLRIDENGYVDDFNVISSPHGSLSFAVRLAARNWFFEPILFDGKPTTTEVKAQFVFQLVP